MNLENLEWERFISLAQGFAATDAARARLRLLEEPDAWAASREAAQEQQSQTAECIGLLEKSSLWGPLHGLGDPTDCLERLSKGAVLEVSELGLIWRWLQAVDSWHQIPKAEIKGERIGAALRGLPHVQEPLRELSRVLTPEGELSERATPRLASLTQEVRRLKQTIQSRLDEVMRGYARQGVLQDEYTDLRDGRYVVPIRMGSQGDVDGVFHEASASKQTVFIEPAEVAPLNNGLRQKQNEIHEEVHRILVATSGVLRKSHDAIQAAARTLTHWDSIQAKARMGRLYRGVPILVQDVLRWRLTSTAHPLLSWSLRDEQIIRNSLEVIPPAQALLFSGPNTGGKTVFLKTLGVAAACARTGFLFPGLERCEIPFFERIYSDLGDPQSLSEHLSTFSGHLMRLRTILEEAGPSTLVLLDELNSSTDPEEGFALSRAVMEDLLARGAWIVATTHDPKLKALAIEDQRVVNASVQFDEKLQAPTYRVILGAPGRSRALETAERLGLPARILTAARSYLTQSHRTFEQALAKLEADVRLAADARSESVRLREEAAKLEREWRIRTEASLQETLARTRMRLRRVLESTQDELRALVLKAQGASKKDLESMRASVQSQFNVAAESMERAFAEEAPELAQIVSKPVEGAQTSAIEIRVGDSVRVPRWKSMGEVLEVKGDKFKVALGKVQFQLRRDEIAPLDVNDAVAKPKVRVESPARDSGSETLDLRGKRFEEAMSELAAFLDVEYRAGSRVSVVIVHGLGTGALREGTRALLDKLPYVKDFRDGGYGGGGAGATVVEFHRS